MPHWLQYDISNMNFDWSFAALSNLPCPRVVSWHSHLWATHVGEATNPGPAEQSRSEDFYVCIANITKLRKHADEVHRLYASFPGITCLAETSADESAIQHFTRSCRWKSLEYYSGSPCGLRGKKYSPPRPEFGGVGIITSPKSRRPTSQLKLEEWCSTRYLETIVQARGFQILVVAMYLHPLADDIHNAKRDINEALMARAAERVGIWGGHAIIAGDLNVPPRTTTLWQFLSPRGWVEAHQHADETLGTPTMPTCRESTWNDTIFFSPSLAPAIREISTFRKFILPTHAPLVTALDLGGVPDTYTIWKTIQPIQLEQLQALREIQYDEFFVDAMCELGQDTSVPDEATMQGWSAAAEMAIHRALIYHEKTGLSKCQRGRGREPVYKNVPYPKGAKIARSGDFQPSTHIGNVPYCQIVKQIRRLDSISRMLKIYPSSIHPIVLDDWKAVRRAKGFKDGFAAWAQSPLPHYPDVDLVHHLLEMLRTHERSVAQKIERQKKAKWTEALNISWKSRGNKLTHQVTSARGNPFLTKACQTDYVTCLALRSRTKGGRLFRVPQGFAYHAQFSCDRGEIKWFDRQNGIFQIDPPISDASVQIKSTTWAHDPRDVHQAFFAYWSQFWDSDEPPGGEYISPDIIPDEWKIRHNVSLSVADFKAAVTHTRNDSAPGADGWRVLELQALCDTAIECWVQFINHTLQGRQGWPSSFSWAKIVLPGKVPDPCNIADGRPINILATMYRVTVKAIAKDVLLKLTSTLPPSLVGGLPKRNPFDLWYSTQYLIELSDKTQSPLFGVVTDLQKFFNSIPRRELARLMIHLGIDETFVHQWIALLFDLKRCVVVQNDISMPCSSRCGVPEGCPFSVVAAIAIGALFVANIQQNTASKALIYIDNIELISNDSGDIETSTQIALEFFRQWNFRVDELKSWAWTSGPNSKIGIKSRFKYVAGAKNLGSFARYKKSTKLGSLSNRIVEGKRRAGQIIALPSDPGSKLNAIRAGAYQSGFYACEVSYIGLNILKSLRSSTAAVFAKQSRGVNPKAVLLTVDRGIHDPRVYVILRTITAAKRALTKFPEQYAQLWPLVVEHDGNPKRAFGPAGTLAAYLASLKIKPRDDGYLVFPGAIPVHFLDDNIQEINDLILLAWKEQVQSEIMNTARAANLPTICAVQCANILGKLEPKDARLIRTYLCGGIVTQTTAKHWKDTTDACVICGLPDTLDHRILHCSATQEIRQAHPEIAQLLPEQARSLWPVCTPEASAVMRYWRCLPIPKVHDTIVCDDITTFYTDGSCQDAKLPFGAQSSWAVVQDPVHGLQPRSYPHGFDSLVEQFRVLQCGRTPGRQSINRAEITAVAIAVATAKNVRIVTDSQVALGHLRFFSNGGEIHGFATHKDFDLLKMLHANVNAWPREDRIIVHLKVKSHFIPERSHENWYHAAGNHAADAAARAALASPVPGMQHIIDEHTRQQRRCQIRLPILYSHIATALRTYMHAINHHEDASDHDGPLHDAPGAVRYIGNPYCDLTLLEDWTERAIWGITFTQSLLRWSAILQWPDETESNGHITWAELAVSFGLFTGCPIPNQHPHIHGTFVTPGIHRSMIHTEKTLGAQAFSLRSALQSTSTITGQRLIPWKLSTADADTKRTFGFRVKAAGLKIRPIIPCAQEVERLMRDFFAKQTGKYALNSKIKILTPNITSALVVDPRDPDHDFKTARLRWIEWYRTHRHIRA